MSDLIIIRLPWPPSINHYYGRGRGGRLYVANRGLEYRTETLLAIKRMNEKRFPFTDKIRMIVYASPPDNRKRDIDNIAKCFWDALTKAGAYKDDSQIVEYQIYKCPVFKGGQLTVYIGDAQDGIELPGKPD